MRATRSSSQKENLPSDVEGIEESKIARSVLADDQTTQYRVMIAPENLSSMRFYTLPHPSKGGPVIFAIEGDFKSAFELLSIEESHRCWFICRKNRVEHDGTLYFLSRIHPSFLLLPFLLKHAKGKFTDVIDVIRSNHRSTHQTLLLLRQSSNLEKHLSKVADIKHVMDCMLVTFNESKTLTWLEDKFNQLKTLLREEGSIHPLIADCDKQLSKYAFGILCDYIDSETAFILKEHLGIPKDLPVVVQSDEDRTAKKSKILTEPTEDYSKGINLPVEKPKPLTSKQQKLALASKGTKSLSSFFKAK